MWQFSVGRYLAEHFRREVVTDVAVIVFLGNGVSGLFRGVTGGARGPRAPGAPGGDDDDDNGPGRGDPSHQFPFDLIRAIRRSSGTLSLYHRPWGAYLGVYE